MPRRPRSLTEYDRAVWQAFARDIKLLAGRAALDVAAPAIPTAAAAPAPKVLAQAVASPSSRAAIAQRHAPAALITGIHPPGLDRSSWNRFHGGRMAPTRTLDLHGKTAQAAFHVLQSFLHNASADHVRCVEIITGRGSGETGGVIRRELPLWLNLPSLRPLVLAAAHPHAFNPGSTRLLLRRPRNH